MHQLRNRAGELTVLVRSSPAGLIQYRSLGRSCSQLGLLQESSYACAGSNASVLKQSVLPAGDRFEVTINAGGVGQFDAGSSCWRKISATGNGSGLLSKASYVQSPVNWHTSSCFSIRGKYWTVPCFARTIASNSTSQSSRQNVDEKRKDISTVEDPFDAPTYNIPEKPVTFTEGASYSLVILAGLGVAGAAGYAVFKELIFEPKEYKIFGKALERIQNDSQVRVRIGSPITGYGQESRNRAARQRIPNRAWTDEDGVEHMEVNFYIRGPHGAGKVFAEMFKDKTDKSWKFTYLIVEITSPTRTQLMLESYVPA
ncbi:probable mitochondrial import inner membrane translocase subunit TIM21 [Nymphaea colorata]|nr:probable mitochondrial import inner membrane translocase subunit TIM21 [Nymphaea colorata]XP_049936983.1 probable mitochondrial import inner membrane translocase subunit TIM21 [Nymphaea colorata]